ncbi:MAG: DUF4369 domain-containing protein [Sodaliphilus sp.]
MNIRNLFSAIILLVLCFFASCSHDSNLSAYSLSITIEAASTHSVRLLVFDPNYQNLRVINSGVLKNGKLTFKGQITEPHIAYLDYGAQEMIPFILEQCPTQITIGKEKVIIWGGEENHRYFAECNKIYSLEKQMKASEASYAYHLADSTLNAKLEASLLSKHKATYNSLQKTITQSILQADNKSILIKEKFINRLDSTHLHQLPKQPHSHHNSAHR